MDDDGVVVVEPERERWERVGSGGTEALVLRLHNSDSCRPQAGEREAERAEKMKEEQRGGER